MENCADKTQGEEKRNGNSTKPKYATVPIRVRVETKKELDTILKKANAKEHGRRVKYDDVIAVSLEKVGETELEAIQERGQSNSDRFEIAFRKRKEKNKRLTKDQFIGQLLNENGIG